MGTTKLTDPGGQRDGSHTPWYHPSYPLIGPYIPPLHPLPPPYVLPTLRTTPPAYHPRGTTGLNGWTTRARAKSARERLTRPSEGLLSGLPATLSKACPKEADNVLPPQDSSLPACMQCIRTSKEGRDGRAPAAPLPRCTEAMPLCITWERWCACMHAPITWWM